MIKFLIYLFLFYIAARLIFGKALGGGVRTKVFRFDTHHHHYNSNEQQSNEGSVTVNKNVGKPKKGNDKNLGEYIDYEEVK